MSTDTPLHSRTNVWTLAAIVVAFVLVTISVTILLAPMSLRVSSRALATLLAVMFAGVATTVVASRTSTMPGSIAKWLLFIGTGSLVVAESVSRLGNPLAGAIYWASATVFLLGLVPLCFVFAAVEVIRSRSIRFGIVIGALGLLLALLGASQ